MTVRIAPKRIDSFLKSVREGCACRVPPCKAGETCLPVIYGKPSSDILVVSENPPITEWQRNLGEDWKDSLNITIGKRGAPPMLAKWLGFSSNEADRRLFWIHRANCYPGGGQKKIRKHCSEKFIDKAISLVDPKAIITLGATAAGYFAKFRSLKGLVEKSLKNEILYTVDGKEYPVVPFSHPSWRVDKWRRDNAALHKRTVFHIKRMT